MLTPRTRASPLRTCTRGGLGLPDRDFYVLPEKEEIRGKYRDHMTAIFKLLGKSTEEAEVRTDDDEKHALNW